MKFRRSIIYTNNRTIIYVSTLSEFLFNLNDPAGVKGRATFQCREIRRIKGIAGRSFRSVEKRENLFS